MSKASAAHVEDEEDDKSIRFRREVMNNMMTRQIVDASSLL